jgi:hypothetical protein
MRQAGRLHHKAPYGQHGLQLCQPPHGSQQVSTTNSCGQQTGGQTTHGGGQQGCGQQGCGAGWAYGTTAEAMAGCGAHC